MKEIARVLTPGGKLFISDSRPNECDITRFVDDYMQFKRMDNRIVDEEINKRSNGYHFGGNRFLYRYSDFQADLVGLNEKAERF